MFAADHSDVVPFTTDVFRVALSERDSPQPLTGNGHSAEPVFTPDRGHIVYISDITVPYDYEIWSMDADGKHLAQLTHERSYLENPVVTRDGKHILALSDKSRASRYDLYEFDRDGTHPRRIAISGLFDDPPHWKPKQRK